MTFHDLWWFLVTFDDYWRFFTMKSGDLSWLIMIYHDKSPSNWERYPQVSSKRWSLPIWENKWCPNWMINTCGIWVFLVIFWHSVVKFWRAYHHSTVCDMYLQICIWQILDVQRYHVCPLWELSTSWRIRMSHYTLKLDYNSPISR